MKNIVENNWHMIFLKETDESQIKKNAYGHEASLVILENADREVLLILRDNITNILFPAYWSVVGGGREKNESAEDAAYRETKEEICFDASNLSLFAQTINPDGPEGSNELINVFLGSIDKPISALSLQEGQNMNFFPYESLEEMKIVPFVKKALLYRSRQE